MNSAEELRLDHSFYSPIERLTPGHDIPIVPIVLNVAIAPRPSLRRCYDLGRAIGEIIRSRPAAERVAVIGTGGMSHTVGVPEYGFINPDLDRQFLRLLASNHVEEILDNWTQEWLEKEGGNGMSEIRMWLAMAGVVAAPPGRCYCTKQCIPGARAPDSFGWIRKQRSSSGRSTDERLPRAEIHLGARPQPVVERKV
jgi:hypothetical protein